MGSLYQKELLDLALLGHGVKVILTYIKIIKKINKKQNKTNKQTNKQQKKTDLTDPNCHKEREVEDKQAFCFCFCVFVFVFIFCFMQLYELGVVRKFVMMD